MRKSRGKERAISSINSHNRRRWTGNVYPYSTVIIRRDKKKKKKKKKKNASYIVNRRRSRVPFAFRYFCEMVCAKKRLINKKDLIDDA